jgi:hypothetical protein
MIAWVPGAGPFPQANAVQTVSDTSGGVSYKREYFSGLGMALSEPVGSRCLYPR